MGHHIFELKYQDEVIKYIKQMGYATEPFEVEDISTGNMNYVYRIKEEETGRTLILKYAAEHTRISEEIPVSTERIKIEAEAIKRLSRYAPQFVPQIHHYDDMNHCILMEDYSDYAILRDKLNQYDTVPDLAQNLSSYLALSLIATFNTSFEEDLQGISDFHNPLCHTSEIFVFTEPFDRSGTTNDIFILSRNLIDAEVFSDQELLNRVSMLKDKFINRRQALLHGDLHTGSIFVKKSSVIVFDYEFAYCGPAGFDVGSLIANLIFSWLHAKASRINGDFMIWIENTIVQLVDELKVKLLHGLTTGLQREESISMNPTLFVEEIVHDTAAFAGVELLRRIIGIAHVKDIVSIENPEYRMEAEKSAVRLAKILIMNNNEIHKGSDFIKGLL